MTQMSPMKQTKLLPNETLFSGVEEDSVNSSSLTLLVLFRLSSFLMSFTEIVVTIFEIIVTMIYIPQLKKQ